MFETSGDILNLVLAISIALLTVFLCWLLFVITQGIRRILSILDEVKGLINSIHEKVDRAEKLFNTLEEKVKNFSSLLPLIMSGINKVIDVLRNRREKKRSSKKRATEQED